MFDGISSNETPLWTLPLFTGKTQLTPWDRYKKRMSCRKVMGGGSHGVKIKRTLKSKKPLKSKFRYFLVINLHLQNSNLIGRSDSEDL